MEQSREEIEKEANLISKKRLEMEQLREVREQEFCGLYFVESLFVD
jgi:hypothetical protein